MSRHENGGNESIGPDAAAYVANLAPGQLRNFSERAYELACKGVSKAPEDSAYASALDVTLYNNQSLYVANRDIRQFALDVWFPYNIEHELRIEYLETASGAGVASAAYNLLRDPDVASTINKLGKYGLSDFVPPAVGIARDLERREKVVERIRLMAPEVATVFDYILKNSVNHRELTKMFGFDPVEDFDPDFDFDTLNLHFDKLDVKIDEFGKIYRESADTLMLAFMGALGLAGIKPAELSLENQAYIERDLMAYERFTPQLRKPGFDKRAALGKYSPVYRNLYDVMTSHFQDSLNELTDYEDLPKITETFNEVCFVGLRMLIQNRSLRQSINNADSEMLIDIAKKACEDSFVILTDLDGGKAKWRLTHEIPLAASILKGIGVKEYMEIADNFDTYVEDHELDIDPHDIGDDELGRALHVPRITPKDAIGSAAIILAQTIFMYVREREMAS